MNNKNILLALLLSVGVGGTYYYLQQEQQCHHGNDDIREYNAADYKPFIQKQFRENWYWLISSPDYDINDMMDTRSPNKREPKYRGKMEIKILIKNGVPVGFGTYYMRSDVLGEILFIAVDKDHRGNRYAAELVNYAIDQLRKRGAKTVKLVTRVDNPGAQKVYTRLNFKETHRTKTFVHYRKDFN